MHAGGGMDIVFYTLYNAQMRQFGNEVYVNDSQLSHNQVTFGGVAVFSTYNTVMCKNTYSELKFSNCTWSENIAIFDLQWIFIHALMESQILVL